MIHSILMWVCGVASLIGLILYLFDKYSNQSISSKITLPLIFLGLILSIIFGITDGNNQSKPQQEFREANNISIEKNENSPVANKIENQTNNYYVKDKKEILVNSTLEVSRDGEDALFLVFKMDNYSNKAGTEPFVQIILYGIKMNGVCKTLGAT